MTSHRQHLATPSGVRICVPEVCIAYTCPMPAGVGLVHRSTWAVQPALSLSITPLCPWTHIKEFFFPLHLPELMILSCAVRCIAPCATVSILSRDNTPQPVTVPCGCACRRSLGPAVAWIFVHAPSAGVSCHL